MLLLCYMSASSGSLSSYNAKCSYFQSREVWRLSREGNGGPISAGQFGSVICIIQDKRMVKAMTNSYCDTALIISSQQNGNMSNDARLLLYICLLLDIYVSFKIRHYSM